MTLYFHVHLILVVSVVRVLFLGAPSFCFVAGCIVITVQQQTNYRFQIQPNANRWNRTASSVRCCFVAAFIQEFYS